MLHLAQQVGEKHQLAVAGTGDQAVIRFAGMLNDVARVLDVTFAAHALKIRLPTFAVGGIGKHEIELVRREVVSGKRRTIRHILCRRAFALDQKVGLGDGEGLRVDLLAEKVDGNVLAALPRQV